MCWSREQELKNRNDHELYLDNFIPVRDLIQLRSDVGQLRTLMQVEVQVSKKLRKMVKEKTLTLSGEDTDLVLDLLFNLKRERDERATASRFRNFISYNQWQDITDIRLLKNVELIAHYQFQAERKYIDELVELFSADAAFKAAVQVICADRDVIQNTKPLFVFYSTMDPQIA